MSYWHSFAVALRLLGRPAGSGYVTLAATVVAAPGLCLAALAVLAFSFSSFAYTASFWPLSKGVNLLPCTLLWPLFCGWGLAILGKGADVHGGRPISRHALGKVEDNHLQLLVAQIFPKDRLNLDEATHLVRHHLLQQLALAGGVQGFLPCAREVLALEGFPLGDDHWELLQGLGLPLLGAHQLEDDGAGRRIVPRIETTEELAPGFIWVLPFHMNNHGPGLWLDHQLLQGAVEDPAGLDQIIVGAHLGDLVLGVAGKVQHLCKLGLGLVDPVDKVLGPLLPGPEPLELLWLEELAVKEKAFASALLADSASSADLRPKLVELIRQGDDLRCKVFHRESHCAWRVTNLLCVDNGSRVPQTPLALQVVSEPTLRYHARAYTRSVNFDRSLQLL